MNKAQKEILQKRLVDEETIIKELKEMYGEALEQVNEYIKNLIESNEEAELQSKIYQQVYQEALKKQIETIISNLENKQYNTVNDYIYDSYDNGYIGVMYDLQYQGIPVTTPINQNMVVKAIENDTKLSKSLYESLDMSKLKKDIRSELSRGLATSSSYDVISTNISVRSKINLSNASRIARTEGHRVQNQAALDAMEDAKKEGADIVKQWDSTLDGNTRESHKILDGQIREIDDYFEVNGHRGKIPGGFGVPGEDINCRCAVLQRAKWALDEEELKRLEERAKYYGLDKSDTFEEFKEKYLNAVNDEPVVTNVRSGDTMTVNTDEIRKNSEICQTCEINHVDYLDVSQHTIQYTDEELITRISGGDMTSGSCSSLGLAWAGNRAGLDVLDYRGGNSMKIFSRRSNILKVADMDGVVSTVQKGYNDVKNATTLLKSMEMNKEYYLATGTHASIVKHTESGYYYLELQSATDSGWTKWGSNTLKKRFGCTKSCTVAGMKFEQTSVLIDVDSLGNSDEFKTMLGYINTNEGSQKKGVSGRVK